MLSLILLFISSTALKFSKEAPELREVSDEIYHFPSLSWPKSLANLHQIHLEKESGVAAECASAFKACAKDAPCTAQLDDVIKAEKIFSQANGCTAMLGEFKAVESESSQKVGFFCWFNMGFGCSKSSHRRRRRGADGDEPYLSGRQGKRSQTESDCLNFRKQDLETANAPTFAATNQNEGKTNYVNALKLLETSYGDCVGLTQTGDSIKTFAEKSGEFAKKVLASTCTQVSTCVDPIATAKVSFLLKVNGFIDKLSR